MPLNFDVTAIADLDHLDDIDVDDIKTKFEWSPVTGVFQVELPDSMSVQGNAFV